jgi:hypothetical protein
MENKKENGKRTQKDASNQYAHGHARIDTE